MQSTLTFVYNEVTELAKYHEVKILCTERSNKDVFYFNDITIIPFKQNIIHEKIVWYLEKRDTSMSRQNKKFKKAITELINDYKPDIVHCHFGYESIKFLDNIDKLSIPLFISFHGYDASQMLRRKCYVNKLNGYLKSNNIIPIYVSNYVKNNLVNSKVNTRNAELLYYGINTNFFNPVSRSIINDDVFIFLQISAFKEKKGHIYALRAFKLFIDCVEDKKKYKLILAGGLTLLEQIKKEAIYLGLSEYIEFTGPITHNEAKKLLLKSNVFLHHSITASNGDTEGLPNAIIEAMAMELPILSTWHAGILELVEDNINGYLVNEKDVTFYAQRMKDILTWGYQSKNREKVTSLFSNEVHFQSLLKIYEKHKNYNSKEIEKLNIAHLFSSYPGSNTTNWLYNLITNIPNCKVTIAAEFYTKHNFYNSEFNYIDNPLASITYYKRQIDTWSLKLYDKMICYLSEKLIGSFNNHLNKEIAKREIDVVHAHFADVGCKYVTIIKQKKLPFVISFYGYDYEYLPHIKPEYKQRYEKLFLKADKFICEGTHGAGILQKMGCPKEKIEIVRLGVEIDKIPFQVKNKTYNRLNLIQIAALREKKGHIYTLKAFNKALIECPNMHLTFVGSGEAKIYNQLEEYIVGNQLEKNVSLFNEIDFNKLHSYLSEFDVFIHPSCYSEDRDCEGGAPIVLLDAQACGLPIISTTHCDIPDEVVDYKTGLLTPEKDIDALAESIKYFFKMTDMEYKNYSLNARRHIEENYSINKNAIRLKEIYNILIHSN